MKHFDAMTWVLGWGVYSNPKAIRKIKENLRILEGQNVLQEFKIFLLARHLNVTYTMVNRHEKCSTKLTAECMSLKEPFKTL